MMTQAVMTIEPLEKLRISIGEVEPHQPCVVPLREGVALCKAGLARDPLGNVPTGTRDKKPVQLEGGPSIQAKKITNGFLDGGLLAVQGCTNLAVLSGEPTAIGDIATLTLASTTIDTADLVLGDHASSGRQIAVQEQADLSVVTSGTANHVSIDDGTDFLVTTADDLVLTAGGTVTVPQWIYQVADPI